MSEQNGNGTRNGFWRVAFQIVTTTFLPAILALLVFLVPSVIKNNEARAEGTRYTADTAQADQAKLRQEIESAKTQMMRDNLECKKDIEKKLDAITGKLDRLAETLNRHLGDR